MFTLPTEVFVNESRIGFKGHLQKVYGNGPTKFQNEIYTKLKFISRTLSCEAQQHTILVGLCLF